MDENQKFHERKSKISWTKIKNLCVKIKNLICENHKFYLRIPQNRLNWFDQFRYTSQTG